MDSAEIPMWSSSTKKFSTIAHQPRRLIGRAVEPRRELAQPRHPLSQLVCHRIVLPGLSAHIENARQGNVCRDTLATLVSSITGISRRSQASGDRFSRAGFGQVPARAVRRPGNDWTLARVGSIVKFRNRATRYGSRPRGNTLESRLMYDSVFTRPAGSTKGLEDGTELAGNLPAGRRPVGGERSGERGSNNE